MNPAELASLYQELLGRAPDPSGIATYTGMDAGKVRDALLGSPEYAGRQAAAVPAAPAIGPAPDLFNGWRTSTTLDPSIQALIDSPYDDVRNMYVQQAYLDILGREADAEGLAHWSSPEAFRASMADGSFLDQFVGPGAGNPNGNMPWDRYAEQRQWDHYQNQARAATAGMNRMPGVFSSYAAIPTDPAAANALFYPVPMQDMSKAENPLFKSLIDASSKDAKKAPKK